MKSKSNTFENIVKPILVLTVICIVVSGLLALTNMVTAPVIARNAQRKADAGRIALLPAADAFQQIEYSDDVVSEVWAAENGAGYVITGSAKGYGGDLPVMVGIGADGVITAIQVMDNSETPNVGKKTMEPAFTDQFKGKSGSDEVAAISGATISSTAVFKVVDAAMAAYQPVKGA